MTEDSLSQAWKQMRKHESGIITAYRYARGCGGHDKYTKTDNLKRNLSLTAKLRQLGYFISKVRGPYIVNYESKYAREVNAVSFLVIDINDSGHLEKKLRELGEEFEQDSILFLPTGGTTGKLIGTNHCPNGYPGYGNVDSLDNPVFGENRQIITHANHPFILSDDNRAISPLNTMFGRWGNAIAANTKWEDLSVTDLSVDGS